MFFKIGVLKSFANFTGKHLCWSLFLKNLQAEGLQLHKSKTPTEVFFCEVCKIFKNTFSYRTPPVTASALPMAASLFSEKSTIKQLFRNLVMTYYFFLLDTSFDVKKSNSFVYKFVVNCQVF